MTKRINKKFKKITYRVGKGELIGLREPGELIEGYLLAYDEETAVALILLPGDKNKAECSSLSFAVRLRDDVYKRTTVDYVNLNSRFEKFFLALVK